MELFVADSSTFLLADGGREFVELIVYSWVVNLSVFRVADGGLGLVVVEPLVTDSSVVCLADDGRKFDSFVC